MTWIRQNTLILSLLGAILLAWLTPQWGAKNGVLHSETLIIIGVVFVFIAQGFRLSTQAIVNGLKFWPLHVFTQFWIFLGVPLLSLLLLLLFRNYLSEGICLGLFFLSVLPTTISSGVTLVSYARGNVAGAVFNTVFANLAAVIILPIWLFWYQSGSSSGAVEAWPIFWKLIKLLLLPFFLGHFSRIFLHRFENPVNSFTRPVCQAIIVFMVYAAFSTSFRDQIWTNVGTVIALQAAIAAVALLLTTSLGVWITGRLIFREAPDQVASFFVGSQKSLAVGIPFSVAFFSTLSSTIDHTLKQSIVILPLLFYHPMQLLLASLLLRFESTLFGVKSSKPTVHNQS